VKTKQNAILISTIDNNGIISASIGGKSDGQNYSLALGDGLELYVTHAPIYKVVYHTEGGSQSGSWNNTKECYVLLDPACPGTRRVTWNNYDLFDQNYVDNQDVMLYIGYDLLSNTEFVVTDTLPEPINDHSASGNSGYTHVLYLRQ